MKSLRHIIRPDKTGIEFGWRVHTAQETWTAKVDGKASIVLAISSGSLFAIFAAHGDGGPLNQGSTLVRLIEIIGIGGALISVAASACAVVPLLGPRNVNLQDRGLIYFGHLRHYDELSLADKLGRLDPNQERKLLAAQLIQMSRRNWLKHRLLQASVAAGLFGGICLVIAVLVNYVEC